MREETSKTDISHPCGNQKEIFSITVNVRVPPFPGLPPPAPVCASLKVMELSTPNANFLLS